MADSYVRNGVVVYLNSAGFPQETPIVALPSASSFGDMDTGGGSVPTYKSHAYTYDGSGNLATDTVTDGQSTWIRTYTWANGAQATDSGWVKQ